VEDLLRQPLRVPFGKGYEIPPPTARVGLRMQRIAVAVMQAQESGDASSVTPEALGLPADYDSNRDLLGAELYEAMLDDLTTDELARVVRAVGSWAMPGVSREAAEASLMDPFQAPPRNRAARRATARRAASSGASSKSTGA